MSLLLILIISLTVLPSPLCLGRLEEDNSYNDTANDQCGIFECFHESTGSCPNIESPCRCHQLPRCRKAVVCCNVNTFQLVEGLACANVSDGVVEALHIQNATLDVLNVTSSTWRRLKYLAITDGHIKSVIGEFSKLTFISCLNLSSNGIRNIDERSLVTLFNLSYLDLSHNNITEVPRFKKEGPVRLDISFNDFILCSSVLDALKKTDLSFKNENETICTTPKRFDWFNFTEHLPLVHIKGLHELDKDCRILNYNCTCKPTRLDIIAGKPPALAVDVNCANRGLKHLPTPLPLNTIALNITNNNITSLEAVNNDPTYSHLRELYADNNEITSVLPLEGSAFIENFIALSLRHNRISSLPMYMFSNAFDRNNILRLVQLGFNHVHCDCNAAKILKVWLLRKQKQIPDYEDICCENMDARVMDLNPSKLCHSTSDWTDYIYYIITVQVLLLIGLIAKVFYDYWIFKTAGYLPWPASKMPKMPCDWLCE